MRLTDKERAVIRETVAEVYGPTAVVRLFGSRVRDDLRGGDIDLHVEVDDPAPDPFPSRQNRIWSLLQDRLGEQRIDIIESRRGQDRRAIEQIAYRDGVSV